jgi:hypothetical protein
MVLLFDDSVTWVRRPNASVSFTRLTDAWSVTDAVFDEYNEFTSVASGGVTFLVRPRPSYSNVVHPSVAWAVD